jgi:type I restriction enzyme S subunit
MEVTPGYKQTEVGVIPEEWALLSMAELFTFQNGVNADKAAYGKGIPFINVLEVITHSTLTEARIPGRISLPPQTSSAFRVQTGDVLFNRTSETQEEVRLASVYIDNKEVVFGGFVIRARPRNGSLNPMFSSYALRSPLIRQQIVSRGQGAVRANIGQQDLSKVRVFVPPLPEQEAIAEVLSKADALIENLERLIAKKRLLKKGAMQQLLTGKRRLPGFANATINYKQTEVGVIPEDWEVKRLGELFEITSSKRVFQSEWKTAGTPFYRARELAVLCENGRVENELFISKEMYNTFKNIYGVPQIGDMLVTGVGTLGKAYVVSDGHEFYFKDGNIIWFKVSGKVRSNFLKQLYLTQLITEQIDNASAGTTVGTYTISSAKKTIIPFPPLAEQEAIAEVLSAMDAEIALLETQLAKYRQLKQGLMQKLLTGRIRLI